MSMVRIRALARRARLAREAMNRPKTMLVNGGGQAEAEGDPDGFKVQGVGKDIDEIVEPDELAALAEGIADHDRLEQALRGRPVEKGQGHQDLRRNQKIGQGPGGEMGSFDHG
jgi:hypothetical protein